MNTIASIAADWKKLASAVELPVMAIQRVAITSSDGLKEVDVLKQMKAFGAEKGWIQWLGKNDVFVDGVLPLREDLLLESDLCKNGSTLTVRADGKGTYKLTLVNVGAAATEAATDMLSEREESHCSKEPLLLVHDIFWDLGDTFRPRFARLVDIGEPQ